MIKLTLYLNKEIAELYFDDIYNLCEVVKGYEIFNKIWLLSVKKKVIVSEDLKWLLYHLKSGCFDELNDIHLHSHEDYESAYNDALEIKTDN